VVQHARWFYYGTLGSVSRLHLLIKGDWVEVNALSGFIFIAIGP
jgi:hypothetical protein